jgi:ParB-like chromosome segregation protein Spo0J
MARKPKAAPKAAAGKLSVEYAATDSLVPYARNSRTHSPEQVSQIAASIREFGFTNPVLIDDKGTIIAGHGRVMAAMKLELAEVPTITLGHLSEAQRRAYVIADNRLALNAGWDDEMLAAEVRTLEDEISQGLADFDISIMGFTDAEISDLLSGMDGGEGEGEGDGSGGTGSLADRFGVVPFSVLNAREGWWQDRKRAWIKLGIRSEVGRGENALGFSKGVNGAMGGKTYDQAKEASKRVEKGLVFGEIENYDGANRGNTSGTSIFDPVLCELIYRWFCPTGGAVFDPFAGGSVRGIVAARLGLEYSGIDLRAEQVAANDQQWTLLADFDNPPPTWVVGDSAFSPSLLPKDYQSDLVFTCPPYGDLEVYSEDPADLSTMEYQKFLAAYREIIAKAVATLKPNRFAAIVVGEIRDKKGLYRDFVGDTIAAFVDAGAAYYNEAILVTAIGSLPIRVGKQFVASRKLGKTHQNVLVFVKGDPKKVVAALDDPEFAEMDGAEPGDHPATEE